MKQNTILILAIAIAAAGALFFGLFMWASKPVSTMAGSSHEERIVNEQIAMFDGGRKDELADICHEKLKSNPTDWEVVNSIYWLIAIKESSFLEYLDSSDPRILFSVGSELGRKGKKSKLIAKISAEKRMALKEDAREINLKFNRPVVPGDSKGSSASTQSVSGAWSWLPLSASMGSE